MSALGTILPTCRPDRRSERDDRELCLVRQERPELEEGPAVQPIPCVLAPSRSPFADSFEVLEGDPRPVRLAVSTYSFVVQ